jgi:hypothetical protein
VNDDEGTEIVWSDLKVGGALMKITDHHAAVEQYQQRIAELERLIARERSSACSRLVSWWSELWRC